MKNTNMTWQFWAGLAISLVCLVLALRQVDFAGVVSALGQVNGWLLLLAVLSVLATFWAKAMRWQMLFHPSSRPPFMRAFSTQSIGMLLNTFAPARLGDLARAYLMGEAQGISKVYVLGTVVVEKFIDLIFLLLALLLLLSQTILPGWIKDSYQRLGIGILVGLVVITLLAWKGERLIDLGARVIGRLPGAWAGWLAQHLHLGLQSLDVFRQPGQLTWVMFWSLMSWLLAASTNALVFAAMDLRLSAWTALLLLVVLQAGVAVPSSPGRIGVFHYLTLLTLLFFGVDRTAALSCGVILHLVVVGPIATVGAIALWWEKITWETLLRASARLSNLARRPA